MLLHEENYVVTFQNPYVALGSRCVHVGNALIEHDSHDDADRLMIKPGMTHTLRQSSLRIVEERKEIKRVRERK